MRAVLTDPILNQLLAAEGYVVVPWLNAKEVTALRNAYENSGDREQKGAFTTFACSDEAYRSQIDEAIKTVFARSFHGHLSAYRPFWGNFFTKPDGADAMPLHADLQYVDEPEHISLNIWCPLVDTTEENGAFGVVPRSHLVTDQLRGVRLPQYYARHAEDIRDRCGTVLRLKAGEAVIYDHRLLHYSLPNRSSQQRLAATLVAVPNHAHVVHYFAQAEGSPFDEYRLNDVRDLLRTPFFNRPEHLTPVRTFTDHPFHDITAEDVLRVQKMDSERWSLPDATAHAAQARLDSHTHRIFRDEVLGKQFVNDGYAVVQGLMDAQAVKELSAFYQHEYTTQAGMYVTHFTNDLEKNRKTSDHIFRVLHSALKDLLRSWRPIIAHYAVKSPGDNNRFDLHQDWGIVDEDRFGVAHVWVALTDVGPENGGLVLIPRSHLAVNRYRSGTIPIRFLPLDTLQDRICQFRLKAGDAVIYHPAVFHGSPANAGNADRMAVIAAVCDQDAELCFFHGNGDAVEVYPLSELDVFSRLPQLAEGNRPQGSPVRTFAGANLKRTDSELIGSLRMLTDLAPAHIPTTC
jgi:ectoine hydroxylase-related dioxygenase (phytanoyl-CoA dioxygenase family)